MKKINTEISDNVVIEAAKEDDVNEACIIIQEAIGQDDGGIAGIFFSGKTNLEDGNIKEWLDASKEERIAMLRAYLKLEELHASE